MQTWNSLLTSLFLEELVRQGLVDIFVAPGSRSTPLVLAAAQNKHIKIHTHFDERGLGYFALGCAKSSQKPCAIVTTSGTAVSNLLPAVTEAFYQKTPLLILSADRPSELIKTGANQAINQQNIFQNFVHDFYEISPANPKTNWDHLLSLAGHCYHTALQKGGPVHLNFHFQEPLAPLEPEFLARDIPAKIQSYFFHKEPFTKFSTKTFTYSDFNFTFDNQEALLVFGSLISQKEKEALLQIAQKLNAPVFCDVQNPLRFCDFPQNIEHFDLLLEVQKLQPKTILHFGGPLISKNLNQLIINFNGQYIHIHPYSEILDPHHIQKTFLQTTPQEFLQKISENEFPTNNLLSSYKEKSKKISQILREEFQDQLNEGTIFHHLSLEQNQYFIGSSMPIRDLERFAGFSQNTYFFNRGTSGIDGNIATAHGIALNQKEKTICIVGDQAFLYDMNSLALHKQLEKTIHTLVINNQGCGIFSFLPVKKIDNQDAFQKLFTNPHEWNLSKAAEVFGLPYKLVQTPQELKAAVQSDISSLIEIKSNILDNLKWHQEITSHIRSLL